MKGAEESAPSPFKLPYFSFHFPPQTIYVMISTAYLFKQRILDE